MRLHHRPAVRCQKAFEGALVRPFVIEPGLPDGGDDDPIAGEIDGVKVALVRTADR